MLLREAIARYVLGKLPDSELPSLAADALEEGLNSPSLACLALADPSHVVSNRSLLQTALKEIAVEVPSRESAVRWLICLAASKILSGELSPQAGANEIWRLTLDDANHDHQFDTFIYAASEWNEPRVTQKMHEQWSKAIREAAEKIVASLPAA